MSEPTPPESSQEPISEVGVIARAEAARRKRGLTLLAVGLCLAAALFVGMSMLSSLGPKLEVQAEEQNTLEETNDPACRGLIADVTAFGERFGKEEVKPLRGVLSDDPEQIKEARARVVRLRAELDALREQSLKANLRYAESREELNDWFKYVDTELRLVDLRGERQLERLAAESRGEVYAEPKPLNERSGKIIGKPKKDEARAPEQKLDDALLAAREAFSRFRVWHTGAMHPCGAAPKS